MTKSRLQIQQKIEILKLPDGERYASSIQEVNDDTISVAVPARRGQYLYLQDGDMVKVEFIDSGAIYGFESKVVGRKKSNQVSLVVLSRPETMTRKQRRNFVRLDINLPVLFRILSGSPGINPDDVHAGMTIDISGGGLQLSSRTQLESGSRIQISLKLDQKDMQDLVLTGKVNWVVPEEAMRSYRFGVCFEDIREAHRERIISYIFAKMRQRAQT